MNTTDAFRNFNAYQRPSPFRGQNGSSQSLQSPPQSNHGPATSNLDLLSLGSPKDEAFRPVSRQQLLALMRPEGADVTTLSPEGIRLAPTMISDQAWRLANSGGDLSSLRRNNDGGVWTSRDLAPRPSLGPVDTSITAF